MVGQNLRARARDLAREVGVPPDVVGVDRDADAFAQLVAEVVGLRDGCLLYTSDAADE